MARYIDADALIMDDDMEDLSAYEANVFEEMINKQPTADVVEVVRCKYCKDYDNHDHRCKFFNHGVAVNDYCSRVIERRKDEQIH